MRVPRIRINKALAAAGLASRRGAEKLITAGKVRVNGVVVTDLATQVDPEKDVLRVEGKRIKAKEPAYYLYHKPRGVISSQRDERGRPCVGDVCRRLAGAPKGVGRLDRASEGLMLLTNDGQAAFRLTHPSYGAAKEYRVTIAPRLKGSDAARLVSGVELDDGLARFEGIALAGEDAGRSRLSITLHEGRSHIIRRAFDALGYEVKRLKRVGMGPLSLGKLGLGATRRLSAKECAALRRALGLK